MPVIFIPAQWRDLTGGVTRVDVDGGNVREAVNALELRFPGIRARLCRGDALTPGLQVCVDDVMTPRGLRVALRPASEVHFLPVIGGG